MSDPLPTHRRGPLRLADVPGKTALGVAEFDRASRSLPQRLRTVLLLVDGQRSVADLRALMPDPALPALLDVLLALGHIEPLPDVAPQAPGPDAFLQPTSDDGADDGDGDERYADDGDDPMLDAGPQTWTPWPWDLPAAAASASRDARPDARLHARLHARLDPRADARVDVRVARPPDRSPQAPGYAPPGDRTVMQRLVLVAAAHLHELVGDDAAALVARLQAAPDLDHLRVELLHAGDEVLRKAGPEAARAFGDEISLAMQTAYL